MASVHCSIHTDGAALDVNVHGSNVYRDRFVTLAFAQATLFLRDEDVPQWVELLRAAASDLEAYIAPTAAPVDAEFDPAF